MSICLFGIYRLETKITRLLDSVLGLVESVFILDTGRPGEEDVMSPLLEKWASTHGVRCLVEKRPFDDFGSSRSESLWRAKRAFPEAKWFLTLDADMVLRPLAGVESILESLSKMDQKAFSLLQQHGQKKWYNLRIFSRDAPWECIGVTHEYWTIPGEEFYGVPFTEMVIDDLADGATRGEKLSRDRHLLEKALQEPSLLEENLLSRYLFYQAQTHQGLSLHKEAYHLYLRRLGRSGGNDLEKYQAFLGAASSLREMALSVVDGDKRNRLLYKAIGLYSAACTFSDSQADAFYDLATLYLEFFPNEEGLRLAERVASLGMRHRTRFSPSESLFYDGYKSVYGLPFILAIVSSSIHPEGKLREMGKRHHKFLLDHLEELPEKIAMKVKAL